jgi:hypothetical protein
MQTTNEFFQRADRIYNPDRLEPLLALGIDVDDAWNHIDTSLSYY